MVHAGFPFGPVAFVASDGNDRGGTRCAQAKPCRTFQAAHDTVDPGGRIVALDTADYGPVEVRKSVAILGNAGIVASIDVPSGNGVTIATPGVDVVLRHLHIGGSKGDFAVEMRAGNSLTLEHCLLSGMSKDGLHVSDATRVSIADTVTRGNGGHGAYLGGRHASVANSRFMDNGGSGLYLEASLLAANASVGDSVASGNGARGFSSRAFRNGTSMSLIRATATGNGGAGFANELVTGFASAKMTLAYSQSTRNAVGVFSTTTALITNSLVYTLGNNVIMLNGMDVDGIVGAVPGQ